ncbi:peptidoglycan DD-metalloendopeptidase family protein [Niabella ginsengisoli]|uniref:Peptidoglycan DD-metalloendopeptidase family protein n=1 Tax=Niabella ginsengisoli TaxID=522298 RepID=A0ABS9SMK6_9BACT|nr:peptidoglycan DD-metalloendopeptidase family protein [Niabella ginsengisoli]MCH5599618.1 peptidoglycan DD-metalloendopeptidase family protein [Niabella ginsengisoli]
MAHIKHYDFKVSQPFKFKSTKKKFEQPEPARNLPPDIAVTSMEPQEGGVLFYHPTPGFTSQDAKLAQFSVAMLIYNKGSKSVDLDKVIIEYKSGSSTLKKEIYLPSDKLIIDPGYAWWWQNSRDYHQTGDVVFLTAPFPTSATLKLYFKGYTSPLSFTKNLKAYNRSLALPFKSADFGKDEHVSGYSMHGGGDQVFAYDLGVQAYVNNGWTGVHPGKAGDKNEHHRIWGKPVYAMADGTVLHFESNIPNNTKLDGSKENMQKQKDDYWGSFDYGGSGNHFYIRHGDVVALYAHLQKGSLTSKFKKNGAVVKKGDLLGKAGNSGNSTGPHLHLHIKTYKNDTEPEGGAFRPLLFNNGFVIGKANYPKPLSNINWSPLQTQGIPGLKDKACFVHPSETHPYCAYPTNWGEVCRFGVSDSTYQLEFDKAWTCGYYPIWIDAYEVSGKLYYNVIFRPSKGIQWVARHGLNGTKYQQEFDTWGKAGYRLINVNSYIASGKILYAAVWIKDSSVSTFAYHGWSLADHESKFQGYARSGWVPANVSCVDLNGKVYVTALWEKRIPGDFIYGLL